MTSAREGGGSWGRQSDRGKMRRERRPNEVGQGPREDMSAKLVWRVLDIHQAGQLCVLSFELVVLSASL